MPRFILFRHGKAVSREEAGSDEERWLLPEAKREVEAVARLLPFKPVEVLSSPLRRARETAEIIAGVWGVAVRVVEELAPGRASCSSLNGLELEGRVLVGHNPDLEELVSCLTGGRVKLEAGGYAYVEAEGLAEGAGRLRALVQPWLAARAVS